MPEETRAGLPIHWMEAGEGARAALLLHCSLASGKAFGPMMEALSPDLAMTAMDLPGHGGSAAFDGVGDYVARAAEAAATFCDKETVLIGHSLGAVVALTLLVERPDLVARAVLVEPVFFAAARGTNAFEAYRTQHAPILQDISAGRREEATAAFNEIWGAGDWGDLPGPMRRTMTRRIGVVEQTGPALDLDVNGLMEEGRLEAVKAPVLFVEGSGTAPIVPAALEKLCARLPDARRAVVEGAAHMSPITHPREVARLVRAHLAG